MLNCDWIKINNQAIKASEYFPNYIPFDHVRFVDSVLIVDNANQEFEAIKEVDIFTTAIVDQRFKDRISDFIKDDKSTIRLDIDSYQPNHLTYSVKPSKNDQLAVFSEIYYEKGWNAYIDGKIVPHFRANYVLRSMIVPSGTKKIEFKFEPETFKTGENVALASSIILLLLLTFVSYKELKA